MENTKERKYAYELFVSDEVYNNSKLEILNKEITTSTINAMVTYLDEGSRKSTINEKVYDVSCIKFIKNKINYEGAIEFAKILKNFKNLEDFQFSHNKIGKIGGEVIIGALRGKKSFYNINLEGCEIGDENVLSLLKILEKNKNITSLNLKNNDICNKDTALALTKFLTDKPNLTINVESNEVETIQELVNVVNSNKINNSTLDNENENPEIDTELKNITKSYLELGLSYKDFIRHLSLKDAFENLKNIDAKDLFNNLFGGKMPHPAGVEGAVGNTEALNLLKQSDPEQLVKFKGSKKLVSQKDIWCIEPEDAFMLLKMSTAQGLIKIYGLENSVKLLKNIKEKLDNYDFKEEQAIEVSNISSLLGAKITELDTIKLNQKEEIKSEEVKSEESPATFDKHIEKIDFSNIDLDFDFSNIDTEFFSDRKMTEDFMSEDYIMGSDSVFPFDV